MGGWIRRVERIVPSVATRHSLIPELPAVTTMKSPSVDVTAYDSLNATGNGNWLTNRPVSSYTDTATTPPGVPIKPTTSKLVPSNASRGLTNASPSSWTRRSSAPSELKVPAHG